MAAPNHRFCTESELVALLKKRDERALDEVYERYWYLLYRSAYNLLSDEDAAKDIVQEVLISLWEKIDEKDISHLKSYLLQALKYRSFMLLRQKYTTQKHLDRIKNLSQQMEYSTEQAVNLSQTHERLTQSVEQLPKRCREVFELSRFSHLNNEQIAIKMGISVKTVENQMTKALRLLRGMMGDLMVLVWVLVAGCWMLVARC